MIKKINIDSVCLHDRFLDHENIKDKLLKKINNAMHYTASQKKHEHNIELQNIISKTDWKLAEDESREWVNFFTPYMRKNFDKFLNELGYNNDYIIQRLWFQHYFESDIHNWHTHEGNMTGVYYLKFDGTDKTQLLNPLDNKLIEIYAKEGDLIMFPSHIIHRCPKVKNEKIIISFNLEIGTFSKDYKKFLKENFTDD